jgi:hypothetical protein
LSHFGRRKILQRSKFRRVAAFSTLLFLSSASIWLVHYWLEPTDGPTRQLSSEWIEENQNLNPNVVAPDLETPSTSGRVIYPYSVVPGGVRTPAELKTVSEHDSAVREHYSQFDFRKARVVTVHEPRLVYLSYRIGDKIYWTAKKVSLHKGEQLITDGTITARMRCGNRVASLPQKYSFSREPSAAMFDQPIGPGSSTEVPFPKDFHSALESRPNSTGWGPAALPPGAAAAGGLSPLGSGYLPIGSPVAPPVRTCGKTGNGSCGSVTGLGPSPQSLPVPEPGTDELICAEILAAIVAWRVLSREQA